MDGKWKTTLTHLQAGPALVELLAPDIEGFYCRRMFSPADLFDLNQTEHAAIFDDCEYAWDALKKLKAFIKAHVRAENHGTLEGHAFIGPQVYIGEGTIIEDGAMIKGPAI